MHCWPVDSIEEGLLYGVNDLWKTRAQKMTSMDMRTHCVRRHHIAMLDEALRESLASLVKCSDVLPCFDYVSFDPFIRN